MVITASILFFLLIGISFVVLPVYATKAKIKNICGDPECGCSKRNK